MKTGTLLIALFTVIPLAAAEGASESQGFEEAISACESSVSQDANGRPSRDEMKTCMTNYGFSEPQGRAPGSEGEGGGRGGPGGRRGHGGRGGGHHGAPPERSEEMKAAMEACKASVTTADENGRPDRTAFEACMTEKGFTRPEKRASSTATDTSTETSSSGASRMRITGRSAK